MLPTVLDEIFTSHRVRKPVDVEAFVAKLASERFVRSVLPRLAWIEKAVSMPLSRSHLRIAALTNSGPLSDLKIAGAPCWLMNLANTSMTRADRMPQGRRRPGIRA